MSTTRSTSDRSRLVLAVIGAALVVVLAIGLLLREHAPGNMGDGFLVGAGLALAACAVAAWRLRHHPGSTTVLERAWTQSGDERDDAVLTRALAVLGLVAPPLTGAAAIAIALGASVEMVLALLLFAQIGAGAISFAVVNRRN